VVTRTQRLTSWHRKRSRHSSPPQTTWLPVS
jgi:hypothetical protein